MKGDFSRWRNEGKRNFAGVLHQQGRVLLDADWNAQTGITNHWQDTAGQDIIGADVAAVPAEQPNGFKIATAANVAGTVQLTVNPGRVWADGLLTQLYGEPDPDSTTPVTRVATYLQPPVQDPAFTTGSIVAGTRDAVVLEVWREEMNGFQLPNLLIEPALGGPDTTERVNTAFAFRLMRLAAGDTCENIVGRLHDDFSKKGKLTVSLQPTVVGGGDCPTVTGGGYTGFEHNLYRIEIAKVDAGTPQFKWSQYGGGLVGRGHFTAPNTVTIKANLQAIINSGLTSFYLEALQYDAALGCWGVTYGAKATLSNDVLTLGATVLGALPSNPLPTDTTFFRLWNDIAAVSAFGNAELPNNVGIFVDFDAPSGANYVAGDYWTFEVRAGEVVNPDVLIDDKAPSGVHYHRVPLGVLTWASNVAVVQPIEDCRHIFQPLTRLSTCCTYRVGDGMHSWGDFDKIQDAINALPDDGGEVCVLPGVYTENVTVDKRHNITIKGCGSRSRVVSPVGTLAVPADPVFHVIESQGIRIQGFAVEADDTGIGILLEGRPLDVVMEDKNPNPPLMNIRLEDLLVRAATRSGIEADFCYFTTIRRCRVEMKDVATAYHGVFFAGEDGLIEDNAIVVPNVDEQFDGLDVVSQLDATATGPAGAALGGLHLGAGCDRVRVINNLIARGIDRGILLGTLITVTTSTGEPVPVQPKPKKDDCFPCKKVDTSIPDPGTDTTRPASGGDLYDIQIIFNRIWNMGGDGIGVAGFFPLGKIDEFISVHGLLIDHNEIRWCLNRALEDITQPMLEAMGYGGISLADVDDLVVRDNVITDNGQDFRDPVCGIFVLHGEGIDISRNHILNNGVKPEDSAESFKSVKRGQRGGIAIVFAVAPVASVTVLNKTVPMQAGFPALTVHDNVVSAPLGRALSATALGAVSVVGNQFTSHGASLRDEQTFIAATVMLVNLGLSNEFYLQLFAFELLAKGNLTAVQSGAPGLDDERLGEYLTNGNILFANNQCSLDLIETGLSIAVSSILILSLDDVGFHDNQCDCNLLDDFVIAHAILFGLSLRVSDNRFKEGVFNCLLSAITVGLFNTTTDNQSTHCLWIIGLPNLTVDHSNVSLVMLTNPAACCTLLMHQENCRKTDPITNTRTRPQTVGFQGMV